MNKQILPIALLAILASAVAFLLLMEKPVVDETPELLFEDFAEHADKLLSIKITNANGELLKATKGMGNWMAKPVQLDNPYPVNESKLKALVEAMADARIRERKTSKQAFLGRLGLRSLDAPDSQASLVEFSNGKKVWELLIGNQASSGVGQFVRIPGKNQAWLMDTVFPLPSDEKGWLKENVFDIEEKHITAVQRVGDKAWSMSRAVDQAQPFVLDNMPQDRELKYPGVVEGVVRNLVSMTFDDLMRKEALELNADRLVAEILVSREKGRTTGSPLTLKLYSIEDEYYLDIANDDIEDDAYWKNVLYKISSFSAGQLNKELDDFLKDIAATDGNATTVIDEGEAPGK